MSFAFHLLCLSYAYQLSQKASSQVVVDASLISIMGYPVKIENANVFIQLGETFDTFDMVDLTNREYKFYVHKAMADEPDIDSNNVGHAFQPPTLGTYYVGLMHASGFAQVTANRAILTVYPNPNCRFDASSYSSYENPREKMTYRDVVLSSYVFFGYLNASSTIATQVNECADVNMNGVLEYRDVLSITYFYLGYLSELPNIIMS